MPAQAGTQFTDQRWLAACMDSRLRGNDVAGAMRALAELRAPVDAFFDKVTVNVTGVHEAERLHANRLALLSEIRAATLTVADFSNIAG